MANPEQRRLGWHELCAGSWLGVALLGTIGPVLFHIPIISALIGAIIITFLYSLVVSQWGRDWPKRL